MEFTYKKYNDMKVKELHEICKKYSIKNYRLLKKEDLIKFVKKKMIQIKKIYKEELYIYLDLFQIFL